MATVCPASALDSKRLGLAEATECKAAGRVLLRQRRAGILAETATRLIAGEDVDRDVMPLLYRTLAAERIVDASLGFIVTDMDHAMRLGFIKGFPRMSSSAALRWISARQSAASSPRHGSRCT
jgi:hypothetical protein